MDPHLPGSYLKAVFQMNGNPLIGILKTNAHDGREEKDTWSFNNNIKKYMIIFGQKHFVMLKQLNNPHSIELTGEETDLLTDTENPCSLIVWNDEVNTFEWVIEALVEICKHSVEQAEQCAMLVHTRGKYAVKSGSYEELKPMCDAITERGIGATIEVLSES